jgi:hypothetical protein
MANFGLVKSFDIDNGELDGVSAQQCFVLGYELAQIDFLLKSGDAIRQPIHADNLSRIQKSCADANRRFRTTWMAGDQSESWLLLEVAPT